MIKIQINMVVTSSQPPLTGSIMLWIAFTTKLDPAQRTTNNYKKLVLHQLQQ